MSRLPDEKPVTIKRAEEITGIRAWKLRNCIKNGSLKSYNLFNSRQLVFVSDIFDLIEASKGIPQKRGGR
jgi:hypothetical protein